jgi:hypothetical protein
MVFKKRVIADYQKKKDKSRPPANLDAPNVVLPYDRNFFTFWVSSIKLSAQLFKSTKLDVKILTHIDDRFLSTHNPAATSLVTISATTFKPPFPPFDFQGLSPPSIEQQQMDAQLPLEEHPEVSLHTELPVHFQPSQLSAQIIPPPSFSDTLLNTSVASHQTDPLFQLQQQLQQLQTQTQEREVQRQSELATITASISQITTLLAALQPHIPNPTLPTPVPIATLPMDPPLDDPNSS